MTATQSRRASMKLFENSSRSSELKGQPLYERRSLRNKCRQWCKKQGPLQGQGRHHFLLKISRGWASEKKMARKGPSKRRRTGKQAIKTRWLIPKWTERRTARTDLIQVMTIIKKRSF